MKKIKVKIPKAEVEFSISLNPKLKTTKELIHNLPLSGFLEIWGEELFLETELEIPEEKPTMEVKAGDVAYWSPGNAVCFFFGPTPLSEENSKKPIPASEVTIIGKIDSFKAAREKFSKLKPLQELFLEK